MQTLLKVGLAVGIAMSIIYLIVHQYAPSITELPNNVHEDKQQPIQAKHANSDDKPIIDTEKTEKQDGHEDSLLKENKLPPVPADIVPVAPIVSQDEKPDSADKDNQDVKPLWSVIVEIAVVACGDRLPETLVMFKSALISSSPTTGFHFHIFADLDLQADFEKQLNTWNAVKIKRAAFTIYNITYPRGDAEAWRKLFKTCATQRLFLPELITSTDDVLYVDTDILFLSGAEQIWNHLQLFNSTQLSALAPEHENPNAGWYNRFARHPYVPPLGVNSGVMLMRLSMMRSVGWVDKMTDYFKQYKLQTTWGDQDLINIFFHFYPDKLYQYPCEWNYRPDHCMYMSVCKTAEKNGIQIVHGNRGVLHNDKQPTFKAVYEAYRDHVFNDSIENLVRKIKDNQKAGAGTPCGRVSHLFTKVLEDKTKSNL